VKFTTIFGWTGEQWAYAKQRHKLHGNAELAADMRGMIALQEWWRSHNWPDPLSIRLEGVVMDGDEAWGAKAMSAAMMAF
jgi:hypothetical protein